jgi:RNA recognition motif-containing protein
MNGSLAASARASLNTNATKGASLKRLFLGNLPYQASEAELQDWFTQAGFQADSVQIVRDKFTGQARGFGFADFTNDQEADRAVQNCNGKEFLGRALVVNEARPMREGGRGDRPRGGGGGRRERY